MKRTTSTPGQQTSTDSAEGFWIELQQAITAEFGTTNAPSEAVWPHTMDQDWCGEFEAEAEGQATR